MTQAGLYVPTSRLLFTVLHLIGSGTFSEDGVKKLATAFSNGPIQHRMCAMMADNFILLVVVDSIFLLEGGGETELGRASAIRFMVEER